MIEKTIRELFKLITLGSKAASEVLRAEDVTPLHAYARADLYKITWIELILKVNQAYIIRF